MIRQIERKHLGECAAVIRASFLTVAQTLHFTQQNAPRFIAFTMTEDRFRSQLEEGWMMFGFFNEAGTIIGYYALSDDCEPACELHHLCVLPDCRHHKVGETLLLHAFEQAKQCDCMKIDIGIVEENTRLKAWYKQYGFVHNSIKKFEFFPFTCGYMSKQL